ncbi:NAD(P)-binding protein [Xylariaceae sp. FL0016]|nr:NAD(P)-binding protein [Xylariaceae sp. FL0016]
MAAAAAAALFGNTGLVGHQIQATLLSLDACKTVYTISRRPPKTESPKLNATVEPDSAKWTSILSSLSPIPATVYSALGTTRAQAGGIQNQWKIDHDLNAEIAKAAHAAGVKTYVFVSSAGTQSFIGGSVPYSKMKQGVENTIKGLEFEQSIILRPGFLLGDREVNHAGGPLMNTVFRALGSVSLALQDKFSQEADVIARAAVKATMLAAEGKAPAKHWILEAGDIVKLGREEWKS